MRSGKTPSLGDIARRVYTATSGIKFGKKSVLRSPGDGLSMPYISQTAFRFL
jgi:hypothetical protein